MPFMIYAVGLVVLLFGGMLVAQEVGRRIGQRQRADDPEGAQAGIGAVDGAVFGLLGLLIAFTFSGAAGRFEDRRELIVQEANAVGTAYLRLDVLPPEARDPLRQKFRDYLDMRLAIYGKLPDIEAAKAELDRSTAQQQSIWTSVIDATRGQPPYMTGALLSPLNEMFDIANTRAAATLQHPPNVIYGMLFVFALIGSVLVGYGMSGSRKRNWLYSLGHALILAGTVYVIIDLEYPRLGLIRVDSFDQVLAEVRKGMK